jgi:hypothetical protein
METDSDEVNLLPGNIFSTVLLVKDHQTYVKRQL